MPETKKPETKREEFRRYLGNYKFFDQSHFFVFFFVILNCFFRSSWAPGSFNPIPCHTLRRARKTTRCGRLYEENSYTR